MTRTKISTEFTRINNDVNGNPRFVCHFLALLNAGDHAKADASKFHTFAVSAKYEIALNKARAIGGRKFHNKQFGGGIVFSIYSEAEGNELLDSVREVNTNFLPEWTDKQFAKVKRAIYQHFCSHSYTFKDGSSIAHKTVNVFSYEEFELLAGLAYTSSSNYAGLWVCNAVEIMATDTHKFIGFAMNTDGKVVGIAWDNEENELLIEL